MPSPPKPNHSRSSSKSSRNKPRTPTQTASPASASPQSVRPARRPKTRQQRKADTFPIEPDHPAEPRHLSAHANTFYHHRNLSDASIESSSLLDHRSQQYMRARRPSAAVERNSNDFPSPLRSRRKHKNGSGSNGTSGFMARAGSPGRDSDSSTSTEDDNEETRLLPKDNDSGRSPSSRSKTHGRGSNSIFGSGVWDRPGPSGLGQMVNYPPSMPGSPGPDGRREHQNPFESSLAPGDTFINIDNVDDILPSSPNNSRPNLRRSNNSRAEEDVCFPVDDGILGEEDGTVREGGSRPPSTRARQWPDLAVLEEWSREEKEERSEGIRARRVSDPVMVGGRLRPRAEFWRREMDYEPYRFTYFNEEFPNTIHSHTISELLQPGQTFEEFFRPEARKPDSPYSENDTDHFARESIKSFHNGSANGHGHETTVDNTSFAGETATQRPTFWLDVLNPTDMEMKVLGRAFGIHPLTIEDILLQEDREKVELFRSYYLVAYKTFEQDPTSENYLEPVNFYVIVFREGILSFHFSMVPHTANVRRRIRQLRDYINVSSDWISYALIDDITDAFAPLISAIEEEAEQIDHEILTLHNDPAFDDRKGVGGMLQRVGDCRKKVMGLYRLLGNKADVIKGFAKRCNERWEVAPRSEIGLYLGDIQDHIVTMVSNLSHYEKILSRAFSNYLAQINLKMNERSEQTADVLGRLTVLGTIVLPMNIVTGLWGMNVLVPGQDEPSLAWFAGITGGLICFGFLCYFIAKRVYGIV